jgi:hypothetical protein
VKRDNLLLAPFSPQLEEMEVTLKQGLVESRQRGYIVKGMITPAIAVTCCVNNQRIEPRADLIPKG